MALTAKQTNKQDTCILYLIRKRETYLNLGAIPGNPFTLIDPRNDQFFKTNQKFVIV